MKNFISELLATFALVFCGTGAIIIDQLSGGAITHIGVALTFGLVVMCMIFAFGKISGAHMNPAVSLAMVIAGELKPVKLPVYIGGQTFGALMASITLKMLFPGNQLLGTTLPSGAEMQSFILEVILTFFLMLSILNISKSKQDHFAIIGVAIGGVVGLEALFAGPVCGASMNPVRSLAPALVSGHLEHLWIYLTAPPAGALLAVPVHKLFYNNATF